MTHPLVTTTAVAQTIVANLPDIPGGLTQARIEEWAADKSAVRLLIQRRPLTCLRPCPPCGLPEGAETAWYVPSVVMVASYGVADCPECQLPQVPA